MRWDIEGADCITGEDVNIFVEAATESEARMLAQARSIVISSLTQMPEAVKATEKKEPKYVYKMIQIPRTLTVRGEVGGEAAAFLQQTVNLQSDRGWEFYRVDTIGVVVPAGCLGPLFGQSDRFNNYYVITFRRLEPG